VSGDVRAYGCVGSVRSGRRGHTRPTAPHSPHSIAQDAVHAAHWPPTRRPVAAFGHGAPTVLVQVYLTVSDTRLFINIVVTYK
jgi:hypothetical protein